MIAHEKLKKRKLQLQKEISLAEQYLDEGIDDMKLSNYAPSIGDSLGFVGSGLLSMLDSKSKQGKGLKTAKLLSELSLDKENFIKVIIDKFSLLQKIVSVLRFIKN